jgi:hypothetical protein
MDPASHAVSQHARHPDGSSGGGDEAPGVDGDEVVSPERAILCAACGAEVTRREAQLEVGGRHEHVFMNPAGNVFHVRCFAAAPGAAARGGPSDEYSWFPPLAWRFAHCRACGAQLGWRFEDQPPFFGFIREAIADVD